MNRPLALAVLVILPASAVSGQGLSDVVQQTYGPASAPQRQDTLVAVPGQQTDLRQLAPETQRFSYFAVSRPAPRTYAVHDLVTIVIREDLSIDFQAELSAEKESSTTGTIAEFPKLRLSDLVDAQIGDSAVDPDIELDVEYEREFEGEGDYARRETMSARITARVIDVKPNGTLVLEARKHIASDDETVTLVATGTCRVDDISADNTVFSTQLYDLHVAKHHTGELRNSTKKGPLTRLLDAVFNF